MTAISLSVSHGASFMNMSDYTIGTSAPGTGDIEVRFNTTDTNSKNISHMDVVIALRGVIRALETSGSSITNLVSTWTAASPPPPIT